jgi:receptor expression-enhancing protein 1/2/3/4
MYWVVLACALLVESWTDFILVWIPFYQYLRLLFLLYLVLPQTQGARIIYQTHLHPWLEQNESQIEDFIASAHDRLKAAGIAYLKRAIELLKTNVLGLPPDENLAQQQAASHVADDATPQSYTAALLARFSLPSARWGGQAGTAGADFYNFLASAVTAASGSTTSSGSSSSGAKAADLTASGTLIPPTIRGSSAKMSFIAAQRERLGIVLSALDREATQIAQAEDERRKVREERRKAGSMSLDGEDDEPLVHEKVRNVWDEEGEGLKRPASGLSGFSALSKSRSEADFEKIEAESGAEDGGHIKRRTPGASGLSSWMPWGWGASPSGETAPIVQADAHADTATSTGVEK